MPPASGQAPLPFHFLTIIAPPKPSRLALPVKPLAKTELLDVAAEKSPDRGVV
jgi:hypothetical protein